MIDHSGARNPTKKDIEFTLTQSNEQFEWTAKVYLVCQRKKVSLSCLLEPQGKPRSPCGLSRKFAGRFRLLAQALGWVALGGNMGRTNICATADGKSCSVPGDRQQRLRGPVGTSGEFVGRGSPSGR